MGYSRCSGKANFVLVALEILIEKKLGDRYRWANQLFHNGFYELGEENEDGAITGIVYKKIPHYFDPAKPSVIGNFRIESNGIISKFPCVPKKIRIEAEKIGLENFKYVYGEVPDSEIKWNYH